MWPHRRIRSFLRLFLGLIAPALLSLGCLKTPDRYAASTLDVNVNPPATFEVDGEPFCFAGTNNYYPIFKPKPVVDDLFDAAKSLDFRVMRIWAMLDIGSLDGSVPNTDADSPKQDVYLQYWDPKTKRPAYNDGENGLQRLDYVLSKAAQVNVKLILVLVNNWHQFGGMDQYVVWFGREHHHEFYTDPEIKQAYKNWVHHLITRTNTLTGRPYRDDPTIFAWELANEPRGIGGAGRDTKTGWTKNTITEWAREMSDYIKSVDPNHMVAVGDEGFLDGGGSHWTYEANDGVDHAALTALPSIDFGTFHNYPDHWGTTMEWAKKWIVDHLKIARELDKPTIMEEYGKIVGRAQGNTGPITSGWPKREQAYRTWNELMLKRGGNGTLVWMLGGIDDESPRYPDYDGFGFWKDDETGRLLAGYAKQFEHAPACLAAGGKSAAPSPFAPSPFARVRHAQPARVASVEGEPGALTL